MILARALEYAGQVPLKARVGASPHRCSLPALDEVGIIPEHAEPEGQVVICYLIEGSADGLPTGVTRRT